MSRALSIFEGDFGRAILVEAFTVLAPHAHPEHTILIKHDGADSAYTVRGKRHAFTGDDVILINALELHDNARAAGDPATRLIGIYLSEAWLARTLPALVPRNGLLFPHTNERITPRIRHLSSVLATEMLHERFSSNTRIEFALHELVLALLETYAMPRARHAHSWEGSRLSDHRIRRALALISAAPGMETAINHVATEVGLSRSRFYDLFLRSTGLSPRAYADMLCTQSAIAQLSLSHRTIAEVASTLGFSAQSNFTRFFVRQIGVAPSEYRRAVAHIDFVPTGPSAA